MATEQSVIGEFEARRVRRLLDRLYAGHMRPDETINVSGWRSGNWLSIRWELARADRSHVYGVECRLDLTIDGLAVARARDIIYDFLGHFFARYLEDGREPFTGQRWEEVSFSDHVLHLRGVERNELAEQAADALLAEGAADTGEPEPATG